MQGETMPNIYLYSQNNTIIKQRAVVGGKLGDE